MEYSENKSNKSEVTKYILIAAAFLAVGAVVVFVLIIAPGLGILPSTTPTTTPPPPVDTDTDTDTPDEETPTDEEPDTEEPDTEVPDTDTDTDSGEEEPELPDTGSDPDIDPEQTTPTAAWDLAATSSMECADDDGNLSDVTYTVVLENTGTASGVISSVVDSLETIVTAEMVSNISDGGTYDETTHQITWNNGGSGYTLDIDETETFTFVVQYDKRLDQFSTMETDVTATPGDGSIPPAAAQAVVNVGCDIPDTAIGDEEWTLPIAMITAVLILLALGELRFGLISKLMGEENMDSVKVALGTSEAKSIVEKRLLQKK